MEPGHAMDWNTQLVEQLDWMWVNQFRPRLDGLTDDEYHWEPVPDMWGVRSTGDRYALDGGTPEQPTTIAWRMGHLVGVFADRSARHFNGPAFDRPNHDYGATAGEGVAQLDWAYEIWTAGVRSLGDAGLDRPCGPSEGPFAKYPLSTLVLHINREALHHGAEIALLRDLYPRRPIRA
ncbi:DinB family protein [Actinokineospora inagensis]|uniref:DinB family protein n=1 Tax=Actinokineospora inagensis TaxID=103730 RepID=UPI001FE147B0|nr:DinB family protein [Actinokineospora inagensis]